MPNGDVTVVREVVRGNYQSHILIGLYQFWGLSPRNECAKVQSGLHMQQRSAQSNEQGLIQTKRKKNNMINQQINT